jgi:hypothetical protein
MAEYTVGNATIEITPSFRGFVSAISDQCQQAAEDFGPARDGERMRAMGMTATAKVGAS